MLEDAKKAAKEQAYFMRRALDNADLRSGLKHTSLMLTELKTSLLSPRNYYILFMAIFDYMRGKFKLSQNSKITSKMIHVVVEKWLMSIKQFNMLPKLSQEFTCLLRQEVSIFKVTKWAQKRYLMILSQWWKQYKIL